MAGQKTAVFRKLFEAGGVRYQFFCDLSNALICTTDLQPEDDPEQAWRRDARQMFSQCQRCGKWVCDAVYNVETLECVECSPWEEDPSYCPHCGEKVPENETFCWKCKKRLKYGATRADQPEQR